MSYKKSTHHISLNQQGYLLYGTPQKPARRMKQAPKLGEMPTQIDMDYADTSAIFLPWAQTDWAGGFQKEKWADEATFKKATNIDPITKYGEITLLNTAVSKKVFASGHSFGAGIVWNNLLMIGTNHATLSHLWQSTSADNWTQITTSWANITAVNDFDIYQEKLIMALKKSSGTEYTIQTYDGSAMANVRDTSSEVRMVKVINTRIYAAELNSATNGDKLIYSDDSGVTWTDIITKTGQNRKIIKGVVNYGILYFLIKDGIKVELWKCDGTDVEMIYNFNYLVNPDIKAYLGNIYISGQNENDKTIVYEWNGAMLIVSFEETVSELTMNSQKLTEYKGNLYLQGLVFDGMFWFPSYVLKISSGTTLTPFVSFGTTSAGALYFYADDSSGNLNIYKLNTSAYVSTGNVITGLYINKPAVDKLWYSITLSFKALASGESIKAEYSIDDETTWTEVGGSGNGIASYSSDGAISEKTCYFASAITSRKIQLKITLAGSGSSTPTLRDFIVRHKLEGEDKYVWNINLKCYDEMLLLDDESREIKKGAELRNLLKIVNEKKQVIDFEDVDYWETQLNGALTNSATTITVDNTKSASEQGALKIDNEWILYTGKTATTFTGCARGAKGTQAAAHNDDAAVNNLYKVIINNYQETVSVLITEKADEFIISLNLIEV